MSKLQSLNRSIRSVHLFLIGEGVNSLERIEFGGKIIPKLEKYNIEYDTFILSGGVHGQWNYEPWFSTMSQIDDFVERIL